MPHYHFLLNDETQAPGEAGREFPDLANAIRAAKVLAGEMLCGTPNEVAEVQDWILRIESEPGLILYTIMVYAQPAPAAHDLLPLERSSAPRPEAGPPSHRGH